MAKRFKLKFPSLNIPSFQLCRLKSPSSLPKNPIPAKYRRSTVNRKSFDITFPSMSPDPPPSTPEISFLSSTSLKLPATRSLDDYDYYSSSEFSSRVVETTSSFDTRSSKKKLKKHQRKASHVSTMCGDDIDHHDEDDDSLVLLDSSRSFSSEQFPRGGYYYRDQPSCPRNNVVEERVVAVRESVAVVKKSENPYEDFKRSMLEMITENQMFRVADLEELLQCFLNLNSRQYHGVIVEAFSEIWQTLFSDSHIKHQFSF